MLRQAALSWWQCASSILCHHANASRRSPQLSSTLGRASRHRDLHALVSMHRRTREAALLVSHKPAAPSRRSHLSAPAQRPIVLSPQRRPMQVCIARYRSGAAAALLHALSVNASRFPSSAALTKSVRVARRRVRAIRCQQGCPQVLANLDLAPPQALGAQQFLSWLG